MQRHAEQERQQARKRAAKAVAHAPTRRGRIHWKSPPGGGGGGGYRGGGYRGGAARLSAELAGARASALPDAVLTVRADSRTRLYRWTPRNHGPWAPVGLASQANRYPEPAFSDNHPYLLPLLPTDRLPLSYTLICAGGGGPVTDQERDELLLRLERKVDALTDLPAKVDRILESVQGHRYCGARPEVIVHPAQSGNRPRSAAAVCSRARAAFRRCAAWHPPASGRSGRRYRPRRDR